MVSAGNQAFYSFGRRGSRRHATGVSARGVPHVGGIDSPVAAWRLMKRGCSVVPCTSTATRSCRASQEKVREISDVLTRHRCHQPEARAVRRAAAAGGAHRAPPLRW